MDCHLNCHGELNALVMALPFLALLLARVRAGFRAAVARVAPAKTPGAGPYRDAAPRPPEEPEKRGTFFLCRGCYAAAAGGCHNACLRSAKDAMMASGVTAEEAARGFEKLREGLSCSCGSPLYLRCPVHEPEPELGRDLGHKHAARDCQHDRDGEPDREP